MDSIESLQGVHGDNKPVIYWILLLVTAAAVGSLPLIKVDSSVGAPGQVRPAIERLAVYPAVGGRIESLSVRDNQPVRKGDVLLVIDAAAIDARLTQNAHQAEENDSALGDLDTLLARVKISPESAALDGRFGFLTGTEFLVALPRALRTAQGLRQHALLLSDAQRLLLQRDKALHDLSRSEALHAKGLITDADLDQQQFAKNSIERELDLLLQQTLSRWQSEKIDRELKQTDLRSEAKQLKEQKSLYTLKAPVDGTAMGFNGLNPGLFLPADQIIGEISPGGALQADVYISPRDIGFVAPGQHVNVQVDAFPYSEWGMVGGRVRDLSQDFVQVGQQLAFKAVIDLDRTCLKSAAGAVVELRRGMTVNARFILRKRTLFSILYGKLSDTLDPRNKAAAQ